MVRWFAVALGSGLLFVGCASSAGDHHASSPPSGPPASAAPGAQRPAGKAPPAHPASSAACPSAAHALEGVYHPQRLTLLGACKHAAGRVMVVRQEQDGDLHIDVALDSGYKALLARANYSDQQGDLVVEFMARDSGHLPQPSVGDRIVLTGAWVDDTQHAWNELHPVWAVTLNGGATHTSGLRFGGSPTGDRSYNAADDCRTPGGARCAGYGAGSASDEGESPPRPHHATPSTSGSAGSRSSGGACEPGYSPCLPRASDLNCADIPADKKPVTVTGSDPYGLDRDHNGIGCQSG